MANNSVIKGVAIRFLLSKASDGFLSFISWVSIVGVALGVTALTIVTSVINGFEGELSRVITSMNGDVLLYSRAEPIQDPDRVSQQIQKILPETQAQTSAFLAEVMAAGPDGVSGSVLEGIDLGSIGKVTQIPDRFVIGTLPTKEGEVGVGVSLAEKVGAKVGSKMRIIAPFSGAGHSEPRVMEALVTGIFKMGMYEYDSKFIFTPLPTVQKFLDQPGKVTNFYLKLKPGTDPRLAADDLAKGFEFPFRVKPWIQLNRNLFYAIKLEKAVIAIILTVIIVVAAFNVVSALMMMIHDKTKEIAILKAMGFKKSEIFRLFCFLGLGIGSAGTLLGIVVGLGLALLLAKTHWVHLPSDIYYISFLPVVIRWSEIGWIAAIALLIAFFATLYPAWKVAVRSPLEGLRYE